MSWDGIAPCGTVEYCQMPPTDTPTTRNERTNFGQNVSSWAQLWKFLFLYHIQKTILAVKTFSDSWFLALRWTCHFWPKYWLMVATLKNSAYYHTQKTILLVKNFSKSWFLALKKSAFYHTQKTIVALKTFAKSWFLVLKWTCQFGQNVGSWAQLWKFPFLSHWKDDFSFENLFKILVFNFEMNVPILAKMLAHGRIFEKSCFLLHSKETFCFENLFKLLIFNIGMNVPILTKMLAHVCSFENSAFYLSKDKFSFENFFKILIFSFEMNVPILAKCWHMGKTLKKSIFYQLKRRF